MILYRILLRQNFNKIVPLPKLLFLINLCESKQYIFRISSLLSVNKITYTLEYIERKFINFLLVFQFENVWK